MAASISDRLAVAALALLAVSVALGTFAVAVVLADVWELEFWRGFSFWSLATTTFAAFAGFVAGPAAIARYLAVAPGSIAPKSREALIAAAAIAAVAWALLAQELRS